MTLRHLLLSVLLLPAAAFAGIELPQIISHNMMLQQQTDARLWGWSTPGATITVIPSWGTPVTAVTGDDGRWDVAVPTPAATFTPQAITFSGDGDNIAVGNVLIGEVWFCSGQSNMEMPLRGFWTQPVEGSAQAVAYSGRYPGIRVAKIPKSSAETPQQRGECSWKESCPQNAPDFSALGYFFARSLTDILDVPVGIIDCSYGGSKLESWLPAEIAGAYDDIDLAAEAAGGCDDWHRAAVRYNSMLSPVVGYTVKGFLWNQGESNVGKHDTFPERMAELITTWRTLWGDGDLPFFQVEIPGWNYGDPEGTSAALLREAQQRSATLVPNCDIVSTSDLVYEHELEDIHASQKQPIGERLAFMAAAETYGLDAIAHKYPRLTSLTIDGNKARLRFDNVDGSLTPNDVLPGFEVAGADRIFHPADAILEPETLDVVVTAPDGIDKIESVRYCFKNFAIGKIHSMQGLPMVPFRTDSWQN